jgi:hypothetical protein
LNGHYLCEMSEGEHIEFLDWVTRLSGMVVISGYWSELYDRRLTGWTHFEKDVACLASQISPGDAARRAVDGRQDKMSAVYDYLAGPEFRNRVTAIVDAFTAMRDDLEQEKRAITKAWAKREKQLERVLANTGGLHGDLAGIIGKSLPAIEMLELAALPGDSGSDGKAEVAS